MHLKHGEVFERIYGDGLWGGGSGSGSRDATTLAYRQLLGRILAGGFARRVVDLGCGDWQFSRLIDWTGADYLGIDIVPTVIEANRRDGSSGQKKIRFECADIRDYSLPDADLYLVKDVLQHWPDGDVRSFLTRMAGREMLITNSVGARHTDLKMPGHFRPLDVRRRPFSVPAQELLCYEASPGDIKLVLLVPGGRDVVRRALGLAADVESFPPAAGPQDAAALQKLAILRGRAGDAPEAARLLMIAVRLRPQDPKIHNDLGVALEQCGQFADAARCYRAAVDLKPDFHQVWTNLANAQLHSCDLPGAEAAARRSIQLGPSYPPAHSALGCILMEHGKPREAIDAFSEAVRLKGDFAQAHANLGLALLAWGDFERGWAEHEWRRRNPFYDRPAAAWRGEDLGGRTILLYGEGGLGNVIQFARYVPIVAKLGARVVVECQPALVSLLGSLPGAWRVVAAGDAQANHSALGWDLHCPLMSVPAVLGTTLRTVPTQVPYVRPQPDRVARWGAFLTGVTGFRVGICWQGEQALSYRRNRSIPLSEFAPLAQVPGVRLISLQKAGKVDGNFPVTQLPGLDESGGAFMDTAAVMKNLDLVITCDTSIAHLAGALGVSVWVAFPFAADWRWMLDREDSPWYPTMRLFRQTRAGDWPGVFGRIAAGMREATAI